jgi:hypothetical protein
MKRMLWLAALLLATVGCVRGCPSSRPPIHVNPNMDFQPKYKAQQSSGFFYDGGTMRVPVEGTVPRSTLSPDLRTSPEFTTGIDFWGSQVETHPLPVDEALIARGKERFGIYCAPCHDPNGTGQGILFEKGGIPTTSLLDEKVRDATDGHIFNVITHGQGLMPGYGYPIPVEDRWAIVSYVRELQAEQWWE